MRRLVVEPLRFRRVVRGVVSSRSVCVAVASVLLAVPGVASGQVAGPEPARPAPWEPFRGVAYDLYPGGLQDVLVQEGKLVYPPVSERPHPIIVLVRPCSPGDEAGLRPGDVMLTINGRDAREIPKPWRESRVGVVQEITVRRGEEVIETSLTEIAFGDWDEDCER